MLLKSVLMGFLSFHSVDTTMLKECENHADIISGCVKRDYHSNGNLWIEIPYKNGDKEGIEKWYYENGSLRTETPYKNGRLKGIAKAYYENGSLQAEIQFKNHGIHGDMKIYTEDGKLLALLKIENGEFISGKCFNDRVLTDKEITDFIASGLKSIEEPINYLKEICLKSDSK